MVKKKKIILSNGDVIRVDLDNEVYCGYSFTMDRAFFIDGVLDKKITFSMWDDFSFNGYSYDKYKKEVETISFSFNIDDPLYLPLNNLLMYKNPLIIDDDETYGVLRKYIVLKKEEDKITINITNKMVNDKDYDLIDKWHIFIKNIGSDPRSKIEDAEIKYRLVSFFKEVEEMFIDGYHQITVDEYLETIRIKKLRTCKQD